MLAFLDSEGFLVVRVRGSHHVLRKGALRTTVPVHKNAVLKIGTLHGILRDIKMAPAEFARKWRGS
jgi:predicted RNA binding protein YcfA (HicA-like mRNA interferase family)